MTTPTSLSVLCDPCYTGEHERCTGYRIVHPDLPCGCDGPLRWHPQRLWQRWLAKAARLGLLRWPEYDAIVQPVVSRRSWL